VLHYLEGVRKEPLGKRMVDEELGHREQVRIARILYPIALQSAEIVGVAELRP
jgi:hypothetical protein